MGIGNNRESEEMQVRSCFGAASSSAPAKSSFADLARKVLCMLLAATLVVGFMPLASAPEALAATSSTATSSTASSATANKVDAAYAAEVQFSVL